LSHPQQHNVDIGKEIKERSVGEGGLGRRRQGYRWRDDVNDGSGSAWGTVGGARIAPSLFFFFFFSMEEYWRFGR
jgi:hypothetical protein